MRLDIYSYAHSKCTIFNVRFRWLRRASPALSALGLIIANNKREKLFVVCYNFNNQTDIFLDLHGGEEIIADIAEQLSESGCEVSHEEPSHESSIPSNIETKIERNLLHR